MPSIYASGDQAVSGSPPGGWILSEVTGPGAFAAMVDLQHHDGIEVRLSWIVDDNSATFTWVEHRTVATGDLDVAPAILTPPVPIVTTGRLQLDWYMGALGDPTIPWVIYQL